jgi:hypothetical protein
VKYKTAREKQGELIVVVIYLQTKPYISHCQLEKEVQQQIFFATHQESSQLQ